jgi:hypothetical protein
MVNELRYFVRTRGKIIGPYSESDLLVLRDRGQLKHFHDLSTDRISWFPASRLTSIFNAPVSQSNFSSGSSDASLPTVPVAVKAPSVGNASIWYVAYDDNRRDGPMTQSALKDLVSTGGVYPETLIWRDGMVNWEPLFSLFADWFVKPPVDMLGSIPLVKKSVPETTLTDPLPIVRKGLLLLFASGIAGFLCLPLWPFVCLLAIIGAYYCLKAPEPARIYALAMVTVFVLISVTSVSAYVLLFGFSGLTFEYISGVYSGAIYADFSKFNNLWAGLFLLFVESNLFLHLCASTATLFFLLRFAEIIDEPSVKKSASITLTCQIILAGLLLAIVSSGLVIPYLHLCGVKVFRVGMLPRMITIITVCSVFLMIGLFLCNVLSMVFMYRLQKRVSADFNGSSSVLSDQ